ncbi:MAG: hypothetical protein CBC55_03575 [Gammaproteobacteria bacterium TMED95]|nr:MAG: hypothetical protein CBC55_03575 [Gammaproteobacteria bacterium TMED95]
MKKFLFALSAVTMAVNVNAAQLEHTNSMDVPSPTSLPVGFETVFQKSMDDPNVLFYYGAKAFENGQHDEALKWMLEASRYSFAPAVENVKHMVHHGLGSKANREGVVDFLTYFAQPRGAESADVFAQIYLADYYRGDSCVWLSPEEKATCVVEGSAEPLSATDLEKAYFYFEGAAQQGDQRSQYVTGMMNILGVGVPRNVPLGISYLKEIADNGQPNVAYIIGKIYQDGYWMVSDREIANTWFQKAISYSQHPKSTLETAKNFEAGVVGETESGRISNAVALYKNVLDSISATEEDKAEAAYRLGLIYTHYSQYRDQVKAIYYIERAVELSHTSSNEFGVKALVWLGDKEASSDLTLAVNHYLEAEKQLLSLPLNIQQRHAVVWQKLANAHASGQKDNMEKSTRDFAFYMNKYHRTMAKTHIPAKERASYEGFSAFTFPG